MDDDQIILMTDGSMIYVPKSGHFDYQKREYSKYKNRNCITFMPIVTASGRYVMNLGPFNSDTHNNDASIYNAMTDMEYLNFCDSNRSDEQNMFDDDTLDKLLYFNKKIFNKPDDHMVADRGFYDCEDERLDIPEFLNEPKKTRRKKGQKKPPKRKQLSPAEATKTKRVTFVRHTSERDYGRLKQWEILFGQIPYQRRDCIGDVMKY